MKYLKTYNESNINFFNTKHKVYSIEDNVVNVIIDSLDEWGTILKEKLEFLYVNDDGMYIIKNDDKIFVAKDLKLDEYNINFFIIQQRVEDNHGYYKTVDMMDYDTPQCKKFLKQIDEWDKWINLDGVDILSIIDGKELGIF